MTGRRLDYVIFSVDIGATDGTKTAVSFLSLQPHVPRCCLGCLLHPPIDIQQALIPAHPVSVPIRHASDKSSAVTEASRQAYSLHIMSTSQIQQNTRYIRGIYSCVWRRSCFPGVVCGYGALGIFKSPVGTYNES